MAAATAPVGSTDFSRNPSQALPNPSKNHHGTPFMAVNTVVRGPIKPGMPSATDDSDWAQLQALAFKVRYRLPTEQWVESEDVKWSCPVLTACSPEGFLTAAENKARLSEDVGVSGPDIPRRLAIFGAFVLLLAIFWFGLPRLIWPAPKRPPVKSPKLKTPGARRTSQMGKTRPQTLRPKGRGPSPRTRKPFEKTVIFKSKIDNSEKNK